MKSRILVRCALAAMPLAVVITMAACGSGDGDSGGGASPSVPPASGVATDEHAPNASDEAAVRQLLVQINDAWARGDATAYASFHTTDADLIDFRGTHIAGRQAIADYLQPLLDGVLNGTRVEAEIVDLRFLSPDVAIFHSEGQIVPTGDESVQTFVATRGREGWLIAAFQNTRVEPPPAS